MKTLDRYILQAKVQTAMALLTKWQNHIRVVWEWEQRSAGVNLSSPCVCPRSMASINTGARGLNIDWMEEKAQTLHDKHH